MFYLLFYAFGVITALISPLTAIEQGLSVLGPITLTALFASLLVPFAAFAQTEKWQKFCMQYVLTSLFGMYTVVLKEKGVAIGFVLFACAASVHVAYWMSSIHSRQYRLDQFKLGFATRMPALSELFAMLNGQGRSDEADAIISDCLSGKPASGVRIMKILCEWGMENGDLHMRIRKEIRSNSPTELSHK